MPVPMYHQNFVSNTANIRPSHSSPGPGSAANAAPSKPASPTPARTGHLKDILAPAPALAPEGTPRSPSVQTPAPVANIAPQTATSASTGGPFQLAHTSPNTAYASHQTAQPSPVSNPGQPLVKRSEPGRMRASIACGHCRRSKIKCENPGQQKPCKGCLNAGRACVYGPSESTGQTRRQNVLTPRGDASNGPSSSEAPKAKRTKKTHTPSFDVSHEKEGPAQLSAVLDPQVLTSAVWRELMGIFERHYSVDFPFFHAKRFKKNLSQVQLATAHPSSLPAWFPDEAPEFLLAFLALTARFHDGIVARFGSNSDAVSESYAAEARSRLDRRGQGALPSKSLARAQAYLMLGMHEHMMGRGEEAYSYVGLSIDQVHYEMIHLDQDLDSPRGVSAARHARSKGPRSQPSPSQARRDPDEEEREERVNQEIGRRTLWSCFLLDKYISNGVYRPSRLTASQFTTQLPGSDNIFLYGKNIKTMLLNEDAQDFNKRFQRTRELEQTLSNNSHVDDKLAIKFPSRVREPVSEIGDSEIPLAYCVRALDLYGRINLWCCKGGRKSGSDSEQKIPPWDPESKAYQLGQQLEDLERGLPDNLWYSDRNTQNNDEPPISTSYIIINLVIFVGKFLLHREYLPWHPWEKICPRPKGPIEGPLLEAPHEPLYWEESARKCFRAARNMVDFLHRCRELGVLPETPFVAFCAWLGTFAGIYSWIYPHMDQDGLMHDVKHPTADSLLDDQHSIFALLKQIARRMRMARIWCAMALPLARGLRQLVDRPDKVIPWVCMKEYLADLAATPNEWKIGLIAESSPMRDVSPREDSASVAYPSTKSELPETPSTNGNALQPKGGSWTTVNQISTTSDDGQHQQYTSSYPNAATQPALSQRMQSQSSLHRSDSGLNGEKFAYSLKENRTSLALISEAQFDQIFEVLPVNWTHMSWNYFPELSSDAVDQTVYDAVYYMDYATKDFVTNDINNTHS